MGDSSRWDNNQGGWQVSKVIMVAIDCYCNADIEKPSDIMYFFLQFTEWRGHDSSSGIVGKFFVVRPAGKLCIVSENCPWGLWGLLPFRLDGGSLAENALGKVSGGKGLVEAQ